MSNYILELSVDEIPYPGFKFSGHLADPVNKGEPRNKTESCQIKENLVNPTIS